MKYQYIEPFVNSTIQILDNIIQSDITRGNISLVNNDAIHGEVVIVINVHGDSDGDIILNMDTETALNVCNMMTGEGSDTMTPLGMDALAELGNIMAGNATSALSDLGYGMRISPPIIVARDGLIGRISGLEIFQIPLFTECGEITMNAVLRTN